MGFRIRTRRLSTVAGSPKVGRLMEVVEGRRMCRWDSRWSMSTGYRTRTMRWRGRLVVLILGLRRRALAVVVGGMGGRLMGVCRLRLLMCRLGVIGIDTVTTKDDGGYMRVCCVDRCCLGGFWQRRLVRSGAGRVLSVWDCECMIGRLIERV